MPFVRFAADAEIRTLPNDDGPIPRQVRFFPAGWEGSIPSHQAARARAKGVLAPAVAGSSQHSFAPAVAGSSQFRDKPDEPSESGQAAEETGGHPGRAARRDEGSAAPERG
jgi:hypothetical protein